MKKQTNSKARTPKPSKKGIGASQSFAQAFLRGEEGEHGGAELINAFQQSTWVYSCVTTLAENVSGIPFRILSGTDGNEKVVQGGPVVDLFSRPHPQLDRFQFWELLISWLCLRGEFFIVPLDRSGLLATGKKIDQALVLPPDHFQHVVENNRLVAWRYFAGSQMPLASQVFLPEQIIHHKISNPFDFWRGMSPLTVARLAAQTDYAGGQFMKGLMLNNADTGVIAYTEQQASPEEREMILAALRERKRKAGTADRPLLLWGGFKLEKPTLSSADMQFLEQRKFNRQEICAVFKVPQELIGFSEDSNRSVSDAMRQSFIENRIAPLCVRLEAALEPLIKRGDSKIRGEFHVKGHPVMQAAQRSRLDTSLKAWAMGVPLNTLNKVYDLGFPELPWGNKGYLPFSVEEVGSLGGGSNDSQPDSNEEEEPTEKLGRLLRSAIETVPTPHQCATDADEYAASIAGSVKNKRGKLSKFFFEQRGRVLAKMEANKEELKSFSSVRKSIDDLFDGEAENAELLKKMKSTLLADLEFGGAQLWKEIGLSDFAVPPADATEFLKKRENRLTGVNEETFDKLKSTLTEGLNSGETFDDLVARVKGVFQDASDRRAETIALTETNTAVNSGRFIAMQEAKVERKGWGASNLENVRAAHLQAAKDYESGIEIGEPFVVGGEKLMHPGDPAGSPGNTINCRCYTFALLGEKSKGQPPGAKRFLTWEEYLTAKQGKGGTP